MAKSLEEHLYRSAVTKEEYMDFSTLRKRLQNIAHGLEMHRSSSTGSSSSTASQQQQQQQQQLSSSHSSRGSFHAGSQRGTPQPQDNANWTNNNNNGSLPSSHPMMGAAGAGSGSAAGGGGGMNPQQQASMNNLRQNFNTAQSQNWQNNSGVDSNNNSNVMMGMNNNMQQPQQQMGQQQGMPNMGMQQHVPDNFGQQGGFNPQQSGLGQQSMTQPQQGIGQPQQSQAWASSSSGSLPGAGSLRLESSLTTSGGATDPQKKKVILQQQQRLLLLRHASKCTAGSTCRTKFCSQMVTLWRHMKACRSKNCKTPHCVSSRCVLNHYRICKSNGKTATCEVCGPVMMKIKQKERDDGTSTSIDPLTKDMPMQQTNLQGGMTQQGQQQIPSMESSDELKKVQEQQMKLKRQLESLKQLQKKQDELLKQQRRLEQHAQQVQDPKSPQAQQLRHQQLLLQQLQKKCHNQQLILQQEVQMQMNGGSQPLVQPQALQPQQLSQPVSQQLEQSGAHVMSMGSSPQPPGDSEQPPKKNQRRRSSASTAGKGDKGRRPGSKSLGVGGRRSPTTSKKRNSSSTLSQGQTKKRASSASNISPEAIAEAAKVVSQEEVPKDEPKPVKSEATPTPGNEDTSLIPSMSKEEIEEHMDSLNKKVKLSSRTVTHKCMPILQGLIDDPFGWVFHDAVDPVALGLPDYFDVVKTPMHLELVKKKLENAVYGDIDSFASDVRLVFQNAILYNGETSEVGELAKTMLTKFEEPYQALVQGESQLSSGDKEESG